MAFATHTICFPCNESISEPCSRSGLIIKERLLKKRLVYFRGKVVVKIRSSSRKSIQSQLIRSYTYDLGSRCSYLLSGRRDRVSSMSSTNARIPEAKEAFEFMVQALSNSLNEWSRLQLMKVAGVLACMFLIIPSAGAVDALKTCTCLLRECRDLPKFSAIHSRAELLLQLYVRSFPGISCGLFYLAFILTSRFHRLELAKCISNPSCAANVACLQTCNNRPDETECQIKCGDLFENSVVDEFNECAVSRKKCVPKKSDVGEFPVPDPSVLVKNFNMADFSGKWFISSGLNPSFDTFDCQLHEFHTESNKLVGKLSWRIRTPDGGFIARSAEQRFVQDPVHPGILYNHDNEYLHYQDDWYILSSKIENNPDDYVFVYYRGSNDAWDGYGGAVVYTRSSVLPETIVPELEKAAKSVGRDFNKFIRTDNTCGPEPPLVERLEKTVEEGEKTIIREVEEIEGQVEKTEMTLFERLAEGFKELQQDEENFLRELSKEEKDLLNQLEMEANQVENLFGRALPIRKLR
ncbi:hypothetical protein Pint_20236 [Pistacia integerrima]|uniref:Uncharacterized protein n=1 Tax=Pistacia integerrima TaxID=434235 RepID=A0ACC0X9H1_9ROSI|nr:hypothetical protein Pint_20236 [Pistacia integerrima]